jgi:hypothetical protein
MRAKCHYTLSARRWIRLMAVWLLLAVAGQFVAAWTGGTLAQDKGREKDKGQAKEAEGQKILFLTEDDSPLGKRLSEKGKVEQAVCVRQGAKPSICRLSDLGNAKGAVPKDMSYLIEEILLSEKPTVAASGYFPVSLEQRRYGQLKNITIKGGFDAVFHIQPSVFDGKRLAFTVCEATRSAWPEKPAK